MQRNPSKPCVERQCAHCGQPFFTWPAELRRSPRHGRFCSKSCSARSKRRPLAEVFAAKHHHGAADECWPWIGARNSQGYGIIQQWNYDTHPRSAIRVAAHRLSWELHRGPIPDGLFVCHSCDNPPCVNPAHLFVGTHQDNMDDRTRKGRQGLKLHPERASRGESRPGARLTYEKAEEIRRMRAEGVTFVALAARFGVSRGTIGNVIYRKDWTRR